jgi:hypothetical protein
MVGRVVIVFRGRGLQLELGPSDSVRAYDMRQELLAVFHAKLVLGLIRRSLIDAQLTTELQRAMDKSELRRQERLIALPEEIEFPLRKGPRLIEDVEFPSRKPPKRIEGEER